MQGSLIGQFGKLKWTSNVQIITRRWNRKFAKNSALWWTTELKSWRTNSRGELNW